MVLCSPHVLVHLHTQVHATTLKKEREGRKGKGGVVKGKGERYTKGLVGNQGMLLRIR